MQQIITSVSNPLIKELRSLQQKKYRQKEQKFLLEGYRLVCDAITNGIIPELLVLQADRQERFLHLSAQCKNTVLVTAKVFASLCQTEAPEGVLACAAIPEEPPPTFDNLVLVLDGLQDPGNMGTILRTANAAGIRDIFLLGNAVELYNPKVIRSAMGAIFFVRVHTADSPQALFTLLKHHGYAICVAALSKENYYTQALPKRIALVVGNEGNGVSQASEQAADYLLTLPMQSHAESLNVAVCAGILIFDIQNRR